MSRYIYRMILTLMLTVASHQAIASRYPAEINFGVGDTVGVTIFESAAGGLFIPSEGSVRPGNFIELPNQLVDKSGYITVPYAGPIRAAGRTPQEVEGEIVQKLKARAIEPQAVVTLIKPLE